MNTFAVYKLFYIIDNSFLRSIFYLPYYLGEKITCYSLSRICEKAWIRNSYYLDTLVVGISDLDISIQFTNPPTSQQILNLKFRYKMLKVIFPFLGEMNIYNKTHEDLFSVFNPMEMNRDPYLRKFSRLAGTTDKYQKLVFILRMLESDRKNLSVCPEYRQKKWRAHLSAVGEKEHDSIDLRCIINFISDNMCGDRESYTKALYEFIKTGEFPFLTCREMIILFPHRWAVWVNVNGGVEEGVRALSLTREEKKVVQEMIKWEIMGIYTQLYLLEPGHNVSYYLGLLKKMNLLVSGDQVNLIDRSVDKLINI